MIASRFTTWLAVAVDRANPMLVRRVRQELSNRASVGAYLLMLLVAVIAACVAAAAHGSSNGRGLFAAIASAWTALVCIQALATSRAIAGDRGSSAWDLIELTGLHPLRLISGVVQSSLILGLLGAAALAPFLVMAYLLRGLDLPTVIFALITLPMAGTLLGALAAAIACLGGNRQARQGLSLMMALGLLSSWGMLTAIWANSEMTLSRWMADLMRGDAEAIMGVLALLNSWVVAMALALVLGAALLTHRALDRSSGPRMVWVGIWLNGLLWLGSILLWVGLTKGWSSVSSDLEDGMAICSTIGVCWALILGLFAITEDLDITPRQAKSVLEGGRFKRLAMSLLGPGSGRGARCTLVLLAGSLLLCAPWIPDTPALVVTCHGLMVLMLGDWLARHPLRRFCHGPVARRICTIAVLILLGLVPALCALFVEGSAQRVLIAISPFAGPAELVGRSRSPTDDLGGWIVLFAGALSLLLLLVRARTVGQGHARVLATAEDGNPRS
jgi:hypothetical protein